MTVEELFTLFINHKHSGKPDDGKKITNLEATVIVAPTIILTSPNGTKYLLGVDDDGVLTTVKI